MTKFRTLRLAALAALLALVAGCSTICSTPVISSLCAAPTPTPGAVE